ncbi:MAG: hypothetical protein CM15mP117_24810 [Alphaproteobacteria bacterium]|nr:MAG: hypothetical protein CM15mP117_24810 [Alphaproteobacteria bacterium]
MKQILMTGVGAYLPKKILTNEELSTFLETDDNWIRQRTGIISRRKAEQEELTSDLAVKLPIGPKGVRLRNLLHNFSNYNSRLHFSIDCYNSSAKTWAPIMLLHLMSGGGRICLCSFIAKA